MRINSRCLHDEGEEEWPIKLHLGCGGIYLDGYINCDIDGLLAAEYPALREYNTTTIYDYYARLDGDVDHLPQRRQTVVDWRLDVTYLPYQYGTVDKIVAVQVFEHFSPIKAIEAIQNWNKVLKKGRPLIMSVPDMELTLSMIETDSIFAMRHIRGRAGDKYNSHKAWYTWASLSEILYWAGFSIDVLPNFHFYPALCVRAVKL